MALQTLLPVFLHAQGQLQASALLLYNDACTVVLAALLHYAAEVLVLCFGELDIVAAGGEVLAQFLNVVAHLAYLLFQVYAGTPVFLGLVLEQLHPQERGHDALEGLEAVHLRCLVRYGGKFLVQHKELPGVDVQFGIQLLVAV